VNETVYDPSMFAIGVGGLFCMACGVVLTMLSRNSRLRMELKRAKARCEELADHAWELKEAEARASSLLEAQGDLIVRRDSAGRPVRGGRRRGRRHLGQRRLLCSRRHAARGADWGRRNVVAVAGGAGQRAA